MSQSLNRNLPVYALKMKSKILFAMSYFVYGAFIIYVSVHSQLVLPNDFINVFFSIIFWSLLPIPIIFALKKLDKTFFVKGWQFVSLGMLIFSIGMFIYYTGQHNEFFTEFSRSSSAWQDRIAAGNVMDKEIYDLTMFTYSTIIIFSFLCFLITFIMSYYQEKKSFFGLMAASFIIYFIQIFIYFIIFSRSGA